MRINSQKYRYNNELYNRRIKRSLYAILSMGVGLIFAFLTISNPERGNFKKKEGVETNQEIKKTDKYHNFVEIKLDDTK